MKASWRDKLIAARTTPPPDVKVFVNIGTGRIGTLLFFGINDTLGKSVKTGYVGKVCPTGKALHGCCSAGFREPKSEAPSVAAAGHSRAVREATGAKKN